MSHYTQEQAEEALNDFRILAQVHPCSQYLKFFLCAAFVPMCSPNVDNPILPCQRVCEEVRTDCSPLLQQFGYSWPEQLECTKFPDGGLCMHPYSQSDSGSNNNKPRKPPGSGPDGFGPTPVLIGPPGPNEKGPAVCGQVIYY